MTRNRTSRLVIFLLCLPALQAFSRPDGALAGDSLTVVAVGDIMMGTAWPEEILPPGDGAGIFDNVLQELRGGDIVFGNLEGALADEGEGVKCPKKTRKKRKKEEKSFCFEFRTPTRYASLLSSAGFNALNIANNHSWDFGCDGVASTIETLRKTGIQAVGGDCVATFSIRGKSVAVAGFSYSAPTPYSYPLQDYEGAAELVSGLKYLHDLVIVSFHGGAEGKEAVRIPKEDEIFAGENRGSVVEFARAVIDAGADLVIGHGPHVPRAMELYNGKLVAYSLGNFLTYGKFNLQEASGTSYILRVRLDPETGNFEGGRIEPVVLLDGGIPDPDPEGKAIELVRELTAERGIPGLKISGKGTITPVPEP